MGVAYDHGVDDEAEPCSLPVELNMVERQAVPCRVVEDKLVGEPVLL